MSKGPEFLVSPEFTIPSGIHSRVIHGESLAQLRCQYSLGTLLCSCLDPSRWRLQIVLIPGCLDSPCVWCWMFHLISKSLDRETIGFRYFIVKNHYFTLGSFLLCHAITEYTSRLFIRYSYREQILRDISRLAGRGPGPRHVCFGVHGW